MLSIIGLCVQGWPWRGCELKKAFEWYEKAAEQGHADAQYYLGLMYEIGRGVDQQFHGDAVAFKGRRPGPRGAETITASQSGAGTSSAAAAAEFDYFWRRGEQEQKKERRKERRKKNLIHR